MTGSPSNLENLRAEMLLAVEEELQTAVARVDDSRYPGLHTPLREMLAYSMGWSGSGSGPQAQGKRLRPLLLLLSGQAMVGVEGEWRNTLPAAASVELIHNFSLIHDDIQDRSESRRGRPALWTQVGLAQAINAGDLMFTLAFTQMSGLRRTHPPETALTALSLLSETCVELTRGQYLDMAFETAENFSFESYWSMVSGKTASLLALCTELGALLAGCDETRRAAMRNFGYHLGLAFQAQDDWLGIWGDSTSTGKSTDGDLVSGKKTLPVLYGLDRHGDFADRFRAGPVQPEDVPQLAALLSREGAEVFVRETVDQYTRAALRSLEDALPRDQGAGQALIDLASRLINRKG